MQVHVFQPQSDPTVYGITKEQDGSNLPSQFAPWDYFKSMEIGDTDSGRVTLNSKDIIDAIDSDGYYLTGAKITFKED